MNSKVKFLAKAVGLNAALILAVNSYAGIFDSWGNYDPYYGQCRTKCYRPCINTLDKCSCVSKRDNCGCVHSVNSEPMCGKYVNKHGKVVKHKYNKCKVAEYSRMNRDYYVNWFGGY